MTAPKVADVALAKLKPAEWNPRTIRDERFKNLCDSIQADPEFLWRRPILATADGTIYAGNMRYRAASHLGLKAVPAIVEDVPEQLAKERALRDNAQWGDWKDDQLAEMVYQMAASGSDVKLLGIEEDELARLLGLTGAGGTEGLTDPDELPENVPTRSKPGDLWLLGEHRVLCGDSTVATDVGRVLAGKPSMVWTDPPYGVAIGDKNRYLNSIARSNRVEENLTNDTLDEDSLTQMLRDAFAIAAAECTAGAAWYVAAPAVPLHLRFGEVLRDLGIYRQTLIWAKNNATFAPLGVSYHWAHEPIFYGWVPTGAHRYLGDRKQTTLWEIARPVASPEHPTMKPVELVTRALEHSSTPGDVVYDPFLGSGTTLIAAEQLGRRCYGLEIEPKYVDVILARWENFTGKAAVLDG